MAIVGGLRQRLNFDSTKNEIERALTALGWFDGGRGHLPIQFVTEPVDDRTEVPLNTLVLAAENLSEFEFELGSLYSEHSRTFYCDFYAENQSVGEHFVFDLKDILQGRMPSVSRDGPVIEVFDYTQATPPVIHVLQIENVFVDRAHRFSYPWEKYWWSIVFTGVD